jgi:hypothetical protein
MAQILEQEKTQFQMPGMAKEDDQLIAASSLAASGLADADTGEPLTGIYSNSGFDMVGVLSRLVNR